MPDVVDYSAADGTYEVLCPVCGYKKHAVFTQYDRDEEENRAIRKRMIASVRKHIANKHSKGVI